MMITTPMSRDQITARLMSYGIYCVAAVALAVVIVLNAPGPT